MKTKLLQLALCGASLFAATAANATVLRVNNNGGTAPYTTFKAAHDAAQPGDTIMVEGSEVSYGDVAISKKLTLIGPGYDLVKNEMVSDGVSSARFGEVTISANETKVTGIDCEGITVKASNVVITRNVLRADYSSANISLQAYSPALGQPTVTNPTGVVIHQNFIRGGVDGTFNDKYTPNYSSALITNNIFSDDRRGNTFAYLSNTYLKYNTIIHTNYNTSSLFNKCYNITLENDLVYHNKPSYVSFSLTDAEKGITETGCLQILSVDNPYKDVMRSDKGIRDVELSLDGYTGTYGAFSTNEYSDPYLISGIPTGPYIANIEAPTSVKKGDIIIATVEIKQSR